MEKLKVGLLEDEEFLLKDLILNLEDTFLVDVIFYSLSSKDFIQKMEVHNPGALLLDIDLREGSITGLDIAKRYQLPTLFISGKTNEFNTGLEDLDSNFDFPVMRLRKASGKEQMVRILKKFIQEIRSLEKSKSIILKLLDKGSSKVLLDSIAYMNSEDESSNNKNIYFTDKKPDVLVNFSFSRQEDFGFDRASFLRVNKRTMVNKNNIVENRIKEHIVVVKAMNKAGAQVLVDLSISENYRPDFRKFII